MDPNAHMDKVLANIERKDYAEVRDGIGDMLDWLDAGGAPPDSIKLDKLQRACEDLDYRVHHKLIDDAIALCQRVP